MSKRRHLRLVGRADQPSGRPKVVELWKSYVMQERDIKAKKKDIYDEVQERLAEEEYEDVYVIKKKRVNIDAEAAMKWCRRNMDKEQYKTMFVRAFDVNKFADMVKGKEIDKKELPKGIITVKPSKEVHVREPKTKAKKA